MDLASFLLRGSLCKTSLTIATGGQILVDGFCKEKLQEARHMYVRMCVFMSAFLPENN